MYLKLRVRKDGAVWYEAVYDIVDAASFGEACADAWARLRERKFQAASSVGELYDSLDEHLVGELQGADISFAKIQ